MPQASLARSFAASAVSARLAPSCTSRDDAPEKARFHYLSPKLSSTTLINSIGIDDEKNNLSNLAHDQKKLSKKSDAVISKRGVSDVKYR
ncbi:hypothetical protein AB3X28_13690 [Raoultella terrigena]|uniref:hypothetical protein n=1 Tax=Raoultella terrigena TaxID=577 RepID=UPI00349F444F